MAHSAILGRRPKGWCLKPDFIFNIKVSLSSPRERLEFMIRNHTVSNDTSGWFPPILWELIIRPTPYRDIGAMRIWFTFTGTLGVPGTGALILAVPNAPTYKTFTRYMKPASILLAGAIKRIKTSKSPERILRSSVLPDRSIERLNEVIWLGVFYADTAGSRRAL